MSGEIAIFEGAPPSPLCQGHSKFTDDASVHTFSVQGECITLTHHPSVFPPSAFGLRFADCIDFGGCRTAADIGTGTGLLAILAALKGVPRVVATDVSSAAVALTETNARAMNVLDRIDARQGHFFCDFGGPFDVITANLPQEILPPAYQASLDSLQTQAIDGGGAGGNAILLNFLETAPSYMHAGTKLYVIVNTITDYKKTLKLIHSNYRAELVWEGVTSTKFFVADNIAFFRPMIEAGIVSLIADGAGAWRTRQFIYRLGLPS